MRETILLRKAATLSIGDLNQPVITNYQIAILVFKLYYSRKYRGQPLQPQKNQPNLQDCNRLINQLLDIGVIKINKNFPQYSVFDILGKDSSSSEEVACTVDPFAYVSHLSAMAYHGLTDRLPKMLFLSSPALAKWKAFALERMEKDCEGNIIEYNKSGLPLLRRIKFNKIGQKNVNFFSSIHLGAFKAIKGKKLRVSTLGRTFLDMLRKPDLCGGIYHVIDIYKEYAEQYLNLIVDEINIHGKKIDKVRAGYVLDEACHLKHRVIDSWIDCVQRGGSRKLDSSAEYSSRYSERWCLSINVEGL